MSRNTVPWIQMRECTDAVATYIRTARFFLMTLHGSVIVCAVLFVLTAGCFLLLDGADEADAETKGDYSGYHWVRDGNDVTVTGNGNLSYTSAWDGLEKLTIIPKDGEVHIVDYAFYGHSSLTTVSVNGSIGSIGHSAFDSCDNLTEVTVNGSIGSIGQMVFKECSDLTSFTVQGPVASIGNDAFYNCHNLSALELPGSVESIGNDAFHNCSSLTAVTIDGSVGSIGINGFMDCSSLATLTITGPISWIGQNAFVGCYILKTVNVHCTVDVEPGSTDYEYIAKNADTVNKYHAYSATYDWAEDGKSCTVHLVCANKAEHNQDITDAVITSTVKIPPTSSTMGTTEYSVSGTYEGFAYSSTMEVQDIPVTGNDDLVLYVCIIIAAVIALSGGALLLKKRRS